MSERTPQRFFDSTVAILVTQILGLIAVFFINLMISRHFGAAGKGHISLILYTAETLFSVANLTLGFSTQYMQSKRIGSQRTLFANFIFYSLIAGAVVITGFILSYDWWDSFFQNLTLAQMIPAFVLVVGMLVHEPASQFLVGLFRTGVRAIVVLTQRYLVLVALSALLIAGAPTLPLVTWLYPISYFVSSTFAVLLISRIVGPPSRPSWSLFEGTMKYGAWIYVSNLITQLYIHTDFYMLSLMGTIEEAGVYSVASGLTMPLAMIAIAVSTMFYPKTASESDAGAAATTPIYYRQVILVMIASSLVLGALAYPVLNLYGRGFVVGFLPMLILLGAASVKGLNHLLALHLLGRGKPYVRSLSMLASFIVAAVVCYLSIPTLRLVGAAMAMTAAMITENIILTILYRRLVGGEISALYRFEREDFLRAGKASYEMLIRLRNGLRAHR